MSQAYLPLAAPLSHLSDVASTLGDTIHLRSIAHNLNLPLPPTFVVTSNAFNHFIYHQNLTNKIFNLIAQCDPSKSAAVSSTANSIERLITAQPFEKTLHQKLRAIFQKHIHSYHFTLEVSRTTSSFHPQLHSDAKIHQGDSQFFQLLRQLWASAFTKEAIITLHQHHHHLSHMPHLLVAAFPVPVTSGTVLTRLTNKRLIRLTQLPGITPELYASTPPIHPDIYDVDKSTREVVHQQDIHHEYYFTIDRHGYQKKVIHASKTPPLSQDQIHQLTHQSLGLQNHVFSPLKIIWGLSAHKITIYRINYLDTTAHPLAQSPVLELEPETLITANLHQIVTGYPASPGIISAPARVLNRLTPRVSIKPGEIIVTHEATSQLAPHFKHAVGIITNQGGPTSHAAILARELGLPAVVGTKNATHHIRTGAIITINGQTGQVFQGGLPVYQTRIPLTSNRPPEDISSVKTATKLMLNVSSGLSAAKWRSLSQAGIGVVRGDILLAEYGVHPKKLQSQKKLADYKRFLTSELLRICQEVPDSPVIYHPVELTSAQFAVLQGGKLYESPEPNPLLGFKSAWRILSDPTFFEAEIQVLHALRQNHPCRHLHLKLPQVTYPTQISALKRLVSSQGLHRSASFHLYAGIATPSNIFQIEDYYHAGIDGVIFQLSQLAIFSLGLDALNPEVNQHLDISETGLKSLVLHGIKSAQSFKLKTIATSHLLTRQEDSISHLVSAGITAISVEVKSYHQVKSLIIKAESQIIKPRP